MNCDKTNCPNEATKQVILLLKPLKNIEPATSSPIVFVCDDHSNVQWDDVVGDDSWKQITKQFKQNGMMVPKKEFSSIKVEPIKTTTNNQN